MKRFSSYLIPLLVVILVAVIFGVVLFSDATPSAVTVSSPTATASSPAPSSQSNNQNPNLIPAPASDTSSLSPATVESDVPALDVPVTLETFAQSPALLEMNNSVITYLDTNYMRKSTNGPVYNEIWKRGSRIRMYEDPADGTYYVALMEGNRTCTRETPLKGSAGITSDSVGEWLCRADYPDPIMVKEIQVFLPKNVVAELYSEGYRSVEKISTNTDGVLTFLVSGRVHPVGVEPVDGVESVQVTYDFRDPSYSTVTRVNIKGVTSEEIPMWSVTYSPLSPSVVIPRLESLQSAYWNF